MEQDPEAPDRERSETQTERADRKWEDILQELRVMQTSAQLTAGFLLTLPFQQPFADLSDAQRRFYLGLVVLAALVTALVLTPVAIHRRLSGRHVKARVVDWAHRLLRVALLSLGLLVTGVVAFTFSVVTDAVTTTIATACVALLLSGLLLALPRALVESRH